VRTVKNEIVIIGNLRFGGTEQTPGFLKMLDNHLQFRIVEIPNPSGIGSNVCDGRRSMGFSQSIN
jgi:hypothetical protein